MGKQVLIIYQPIRYNKCHISENGRHKQSKQIMLHVAVFLHVYNKSRVVCTVT